MAKAVRSAKNAELTHFLKTNLAALGATRIAQFFDAKHMVMNAVDKLIALRLCRKACFDVECIQKAAAVFFQPTSKLGCPILSAAGIKGFAFSVSFTIDFGD